MCLASLASAARGGQKEHTCLQETCSQSEEFIKTARMSNCESALDTMTVEHMWAVQNLLLILAAGDDRTGQQDEHEHSPTMMHFSYALVQHHDVDSAKFKAVKFTTQLAPERQVQPGQQVSFDRRCAALDSGMLRPVGLRQ